ncbi:septal ring lytic transglycosylase RlpA family protein [Hyphomicrobium sp. CS1GBMeth3]|uniref:septal ring lytic transglycosylase RlpA family protein n=1 Tax=Hyphomicrobium sp. CS1GBMeth3 TaxID=1892845 RepID=UPI000931B055|nr:septal ring lytic transglycosylase RlpA family protein [Hyphomicrobium sp. CS1GBMeth3]
MRVLALGAVAALSFGLMGTIPASANHDHRSHASDKEHHAKKKVYKKKASYKHRKAARKHTTTYRKTAKRAKAYSGSHAKSGIASYYWQGQKTASGARFNPSAMTAAHRTLPFGTKVRVTNRNNGRSVTVTINDRGPFIKGRVIDLSKGAAGVIGMQGSGLAPVSIEVLGRG